MFAFRIKNEYRDACVYIRVRKFRNEKEYCFEGNCFSGLRKNLNYEDVETMLTEEDFDVILKNDCSANGYRKAENIIRKLESDKAIDFSNKIMREEKEILCEDYDISDYEIEDLFYERDDLYHDRSFIVTVYEDSEELAEETLESFIDGKILEHLWNYIDLDSYGTDIYYYDNMYYKLNDGRIVMFGSWK